MNLYFRGKGVVSLLAVCLLIALAVPRECPAIASSNVPLDSPIYSYLDKLASLGLISSDFKGIRPITRAEAARLLLEAEKVRNRELQRVVDGDNDCDLYGFPWEVDGSAGLRGGGFLAREIISELRQHLQREINLAEETERAPGFALNPFSAFRARYVYLDGAPRNYNRLVNDPGDDRLWGIFGPIRPKNPFPSPVAQHGSEGTPLLENNQGAAYRRGSNADIRFTSEAYLGRYISVLVEPMFLYEKHGDARHTDLKQVRLNKGYVKLGGGAIELQVGRDENWLGFGFRGAGILTNNARNFDSVKLSSPEPISIKYLGDIKYEFIFSRFDETGTGTSRRRPYFFTSTIMYKPTDILELGLNVARQQGGPGVSNSLGDWLRGLYGGTNSDNSNNLANFEFRLRMPFLRNTEIYGENTFEDLPSAESYLAGIYIPRLTSSGRDDLRFEYFRGNNILYTNGSFPAGYVYHGLPVGHSQGGATEEYFVRCSHWFSARTKLALDYYYRTRGTFGRLPLNDSGQVDLNGVMQAVERTNGLRVWWRMPIVRHIDAECMYGWERVKNFNLVGGENRTNQLVKVDLTYRF